MSLCNASHCTAPILTATQALQLAQRLRNASMTFFQRFWLVADSKGAYNRKGRKIPPYGVYVGIEARTAEYMRDTEKKLLGALGVRSPPADVLEVYQDALREMRHGCERWEKRGKSGASKDDLWNNPDPNDLSAAIGAIDPKIRPCVHIIHSESVE